MRCNVIKIKGSYKRTRRTCNRINQNHKKRISSGLNFKTMEVHAHSHTPRKKWTHYFWGFLMLFLAVFCGFLAENQRVHCVEHQREKQYIRSKIEDVRSDTAIFNGGIPSANKILARN